MSHTNETISKPVLLRGDVKPVIGSNKDTLSGVCTDPNINQWSKWKPTKSTVKVNLTKNDIIAARASITPTQPLTVLKSAITPNGVAAPVDKTVSEVIAQISPYSYNRPTGGNYPFRLLDFDGYNHKTTPPDNGAKNLNVLLDSFDDYANTGQTSTNDSSNIYNWTITSPSLYSFSNIGVKLGEGSADNIGFTGSSDAIPLPWIFAHAGNCRLGVAIRLKTTGNSLTSNKWIIFVGQKTLNTNNTTASMIPSISTNIRMYRELINQCTNYENKFDMIPILVENLILDFVALEGSGGKVLQSAISITSATNIYAFPSGAKNVIFNISKGEPLPDISGAELVYGNKGWYLATIFTGTYAQVGGSDSAHKFPVNNWAIIRPAASTKTETVTVTLRTGIISASSGSPAMQYTDIYKQVVTITAGKTSVINGYTFYGTALGGGPALTIYGYQGIADNYEILVS